MILYLLQYLMLLLLLIKKVVAKDSNVNPIETGHKALIYLKSVNYSRQYRINVTSKSNPSETLEATAATASGDGSNTNNQTQLRVGDYYT